MRFLTRRTCVLLLLAVMVAGAAAQIGQTTGRIEGTVTDPSGAVIPGVTVTLASATGVRNLMSDGAGRLIFPFLAPGEYDLKIDHPGFKPFERKGIMVRLGNTITVNLQLSLTELNESETVTAAAPLVDTTTTTIGANFADDIYIKIPLRRNFMALVSLAPSASDGGSVGSANPSISGGTGLENNYMVDGINITNSGFGAIGTYSNFLYGSLGSGVNFDFVQEVQVKSGGFEAEYGQSTGGVVNVVTKSGGNDFHGGIYLYGQPSGFQSGQAQPNLYRLGKSTENLAQQNADVGLDLSGYLLKDRLFFYFGFNPSRTINFNRAPAGYGQDVDGMKLYEQQTDIYSWSAKLTWALHQNHNLEFSTFADPSSTSEGPNRDMTEMGEGAYSSLHYGSWNWIARYNGVITPDWFLTLSVARAYNHFDENFLHGDQPAMWDFVSYYYNYILPYNPGAPPTNYSYLVTGGAGTIMNNRGDNWQFNLKTSWRFNAGGFHSMDAGYVHEKIDFTGLFGYTGPDVNVPAYPGAGFPGATSHGAWLNHMWLSPSMLDPSNPDTNPIDLNGDGQIDFYDAVYWQIRGLVSDPLRDSETRYHSFYVQDAWQINRRLTLKLGLRYDYQELSGKEESYVFDGNWAPRVGIVFDPEGDGTSKVYGSWGRFFEKIPNDLALRAFNGESMLTNVFWADPTMTIFLNPMIGIPYVGQVGGTVPTLPDTKAMYQDELVLGYERQINPSLALGARFIFRDLKRVLETVGNLTVEQVYGQLPLSYYVGNPSDTADYFDNMTGALGPDGQPDGYGQPERSYNAFEVTLEKRFSQGLQFLANYRVSKLWGNYEGLYRNDNQQDDPNLSSLFDFRNSPMLYSQYVPGYLNTDRRHTFNLNGFYTFPSSLTLGVGVRLSSGIPLTPLGTQPVYKSDGEIALEPRGSDGRGDWINTVDLHADYPFHFGERFRVRLAADLFNILNRQKVTSYDQKYQLSFVPNPDYLTAETFQRPFTARVSVRFEF